ncbi:DUF6063 family protein [Deferrisoma palaeochoriense]
MAPDERGETLPLSAIRTALRAFRRLLVHGEITERDPELLTAVLADAGVAEVLGVLEEEFDVRVLRGRNRVDLSPNPENREIGFRFSDLQARFGDRTGAVYLVILGLLALYFRSGNFRVPDFDYVEVFDLEEFLTRKARAVVERGEARVAAVEEAVGTRVFGPCLDWLRRDKFKEGKGQRSTRYGVIQSAVIFLEAQGLVHREKTVGQNARIYPTEKLKAQAEALALDDRYRAMLAVLGGDEEALAAWEPAEPAPAPEPEAPPPEPKPRRRRKAKAPKPQVLDLFGGEGE